MIVKHYNGGIYEVILDGTRVISISLIPPEAPIGSIKATHTETGKEVTAYLIGGDYYTVGESMVIYQAESDGRVWARPEGMFWEQGMFNDTFSPRFAIIGE